MGSPEIFFSIVVPTYNRAPLLKETLLSILQQHAADFELIVVDDGSGANTGEVVGMFGDQRIVYIRTSNRERGAARNSGLSIAKGEYVNFFDSDDTMRPCLSGIRDFILQNDHPEVVYGIVEDADGRAVSKISG